MLLNLKSISVIRNVYLYVYYYAMNENEQDTENGCSGVGCFLFLLHQRKNLVSHDVKNRKLIRIFQSSHIFG